MPFITQGKTNLKYILIVVVLAVIVGGGILGYYYSWIADLDARLAQLEQKLPEVKSPEKAIPIPPTTKETFDLAKIETLVSFYDSNNIKKKIILYNTWFKDQKNVIYLTDENLTRDSAIEIIDIGISEVIESPHISVGGDKRYIVIELLSPGGRYIVITDESGRVVTPSIISTNPQIIEEIKKLEVGWGQHGISFQEWVDSKIFIMNIALANGSLYRINIDVTTGKAIGKPQKTE